MFAATSPPASRLAAARSLPAVAVVTAVLAAGLAGCDASRSNQGGANRAAPVSPAPDDASTPTAAVAPPPVAPPPAASGGEKPGGEKPPVETTKGAAPAKGAAPVVASEEPATKVDGRANEGDGGGAQADPVSTERLFLLLPGGPLLVELRLTLDGRPLGASLDATLDRLLDEADADGDDRTTWDELLARPEYQRGLYGNEPVGADAAARRQLLQRYDWNRDKAADRDELFRWLVREPSRARALVFETAPQTLGADDPTEELRKVVDVDGDGRLNAEERAGAGARLAALDVDDDELLVRDELQTAEATMEPPATAMRPPTASGPSSVVRIGEKTDWAQFQRSLQDAYSDGGPLGADVWPDAGPLFQELDVNRDGRIGRSEWSLTKVVDPDLRWTIAFGPTGPQSTLDDVSPRLKAVRQETSAGPLARFASPRLTLDVDRPSGTPPDFTEQARAVVAAADADRNEYLDEAEAAGAMFADADQDGDGKLYAAELATALRRRQSIAVDQLRFVAGFHPDPWWRRLDVDDDDTLDRRELETAADRLAECDVDGDGFVTVDELPAHFRMTVRRGPGEGADAPAGPRPGRADGAPAWFVQMDENGDGSISRREFPGTKELFERLDADHDRRLDWPELRDRPAAPGPSASPVETPDAGDGESEGGGEPAGEDRRK